MRFSVTLSRFIGYPIISNGPDFSPTFTKTLFVNHSSPRPTERKKNEKGS